MHHRKGAEHACQALHSIGKEGKREMRLRCRFLYGLCLSPPRSKTHWLIWFPFPFTLTRSVQKDMPIIQTQHTIFFSPPVLLLGSCTAQLITALPLNIFLGADNVDSYPPPSPLFFSSPCLQKQPAHVC